ncbi:MAG: hypothetical protein B7Z60_06705 [Ferrovum sp. 37-45-19]|jgi:3-deoxy-D-manno-octulosonic-acid transferase|uniref:3-deoxy-D-manno-octulosonic acid transferase n=1 Tax=Ferrovum sp. JA12 TaxID=1356299 RepID=UPI0007027606|nr:3-deoxy-D-manno-octulosonic acid transferase [Ferrovum sp. JA12]OYV79353.1 MAG: hypothetical protein B7Z65_06425 [Ferrovum sp. 21-44-67]OYV94008.1 MAG: hypothetical protein B7Z60_06705 [Ferrovum sp. 37-45-19]HQT81843.1 3-deoxy-D-manno-octulosonic acid transferase [Ferrovaceae bacterium]KRH79356.1 3-deoxy-D-manno-octulosonic acid transferase [Ferrovum sp. JA12]HQU06796.1 3-deoxy-D-manno-octulosonic acid transferase [Ferrovaceae bacterium]
MIRYRFIIALLLPFAFLRLLWKSRLDSRYRQHWLERLGFIPLIKQGPVIWLHAVSVGETRAAVSLIQQINILYPDHKIILTHMTPTGRSTEERVLNTLALRYYLPYDTPGAVKRFLNRLQPDLGILLETEIWPELISQCHQQSIPLLLVNARLSQRSYERYQRYQPLTKNILQQLSVIATQSAQDAERFKLLGAQEVVVVGNIKFDAARALQQNSQDNLRRLWSQERKVWLAASTRPGEEEIIINLFQRLNIEHQLLILVPRHPQRFQEVAALLHKKNIRFIRRSQQQPIPDNVGVLLGDSMGEMGNYYQGADLAVMGGSILPFGGQNLIEATAMGCPVIVGPHTYNFQEAVHFALDAGAAVRFEKTDELLSIIPQLLNDTRKRTAMGEAGQHFTLTHQGATSTILTLIQRQIAHSKL